MGRPTDLNDHVIRVVTEAIRKGVPNREAARFAGISEATFYAWQKRGREGEAPYTEFVEAIAQARAECQEQLVQGLNEAGADPKNWKALAWILERRFPSDWGQTLTMRVESEVAKELGEFLAEMRDAISPEAWGEVKSFVDGLGSSAKARREQAATH